jgi:hypothetical protein
MDNCTTQIGQLGFPFPSEILKQRLNERSIKYRTEEVGNYEGSGMSSEVFFVASKDVEVVITLRDQVEREDAVLEKNKHPLLKKLQYVALVTIICLILYIALKIFFID